MSQTPFEPVQHRTKVQALSAQITAIAREMGPDSKLPTVLQLCQMLGVSVTTLNSALADLERQKVIYRKHGVGIFVSPQLSQKAVGLVCAPDFFRAGMSPFWQELIGGVRERAASKRELFRFYLALPPGQDGVPVTPDLQEDVSAGKVDGVFFVGNNKDAVGWLESHGVPVVTFAGRAKYNVQIDYPAMVRNAVAHLAKNGCQRIALMMPCESHSRSSEPQKRSRVDLALEKSLLEVGLTYDPALVWDVFYTATPFSETAQDQGYDGAMYLLKNHVPDGIVILDDMMSRGALVAMQKLGLKPGADVQIATHTNRGSAVMHGYESDLYFLELDPARLVRVMFEMLEQLMAGQEPPEVSVFVPPGSV